MNFKLTVAAIKNARLIGIIRDSDTERAIKTAHALFEGGIRVIELVQTIPAANTAIREVSQALADAGVPEVRVCNRSAARAKTLCRDIGGPLVDTPWADRAAVLADAALLVNATSLGMAEQASLDIDLARLPETAVVNDLVYAPLETPLLATARARGNRTVDRSEERRVGDEWRSRGWP